jgi:hypothetical protein
MNQNSTQSEPARPIKESPERDPQVGFDLRTQIFDASTGKMIKYQPYLRYTDKVKGVVYERDGVFFYENGEVADKSIWGEPKTKTVSRQVTANTVEELQAKLESQQKKIEELTARNDRGDEKEPPREKSYQQNKVG